MGQHMINLLSTNTSTAADMTHNLSVLGNGSMHNGIEKLWLNGYCLGAATTAVLIVGGYIVYRAITRKRRRSIMMDNFGVVYETGYKAGQRSVEKATVPQNDN